MDFIPLLTFIIALASSMLSGIAGVGGGLIMTPYWLLIGMTPVQAATTGSFMALGMGISSLAAFRNTKYFPKNDGTVVRLVVITVVAAVVGSLILPHVDASSFKVTLAVIIIVSLPLLFIDKNKLDLGRYDYATGYTLYTLFVFAGSVIFSSTFAVLIAILLPAMFNLSILQSTALRRLLVVIQLSILFTILAVQGGFVWQQALVGLLGGVIGSYVGTKFAINKGEKFARYALAAGALVSSLALLM